MRSQATTLVSARLGYKLTERVRLRAEVFQSARPPRQPDRLLLHLTAARRARSRCGRRAFSPGRAALFPSLRHRLILMRRFPCRTVACRSRAGGNSGCGSGLFPAREPHVGRLAAVGRRSGMRGGAALLAVFALLLQTAVLVLHRPPAPPALVKSAAAQSPAHHHHHHGAAAEPQKPADPEPAKAPSKHAGPHCPLCFRLQLAGTFLPPLAPIAVAPARTSVAPALPAAPPPRVSAEPWITARPRAPPRTV